MFTDMPVQGCTLANLGFEALSREALVGWKVGRRRGTNFSKAHETSGRIAVIVRYKFSFLLSTVVGERCLIGEALKKPFGTWGCRPCLVAGEGRQAALSRVGAPPLIVFASQCMPKDRR